MLVIWLHIILVETFHVKAKDIAWVKNHMHENIAIFLSR